MSRRIIVLTERRTHPTRLPRDEANFLLAHARHLIDVVPAFEHRTYRLTPRGYVGFIDGPNTRYAIGPKIPWPNLCLMLGLSPEAAGDTTAPEGGLLAVLATAFVERLESVTRAGLIPGYGDASAVSSFMRGKLRTADQMRDAASGAFPDQFHIDEQVFDLHTPWNRVPKATLSALLRRDDLSDTLRARLEAAAVPLAVVPDEPATDADFDAAHAEPRAVGYKPMLDVCRQILGGLSCADPLGIGSSAFLIDLGRAFERYLAVGLQRELAARGGWTITLQPPFKVGPTELTPDLLLHKDGEPWAVLDAKWKTAKPDPDDLHQVLAYATLTGAKRVGLVYPGKTDDRAHFSTPGRSVRVSLYRLRMVGTTDQLARSLTRLALRV